jgi:hypothetical protein
MGDQMTTTRAQTDLTDSMDDAADATRSKAGQVKDAVGGAVDRVPEVLESAKTGAERAAAGLPDAAERARLGVADTTTRLQTLPDDTLRLLAAASVGLATGFFLSGAPRLVIVAALAPAVLVGGAMATRK